MVLESSWDSEQDDTKFAKFHCRKNWHIFLCKQNFKPWSEPNEALIWGNDLESTRGKKSFDLIWYIYILPMFGFVCKKLHFSRQTVEIASLSLHCFAHRTNRYLTPNPRSPPDSFWRHESNGELRISKWASVRNHVFRGKLFCLDLRETLITWYPWLYFGNRAYPWTFVEE